MPQSSPLRWHVSSSALAVGGSPDRDRRLSLRIRRMPLVRLSCIIRPNSLTSVEGGTATLFDTAGCSRPRNKPTYSPAMRHHPRHPAHPPLIPAPTAPASLFFTGGIGACFTAEQTPSATLAEVAVHGDIWPLYCADAMRRNPASGPLGIQRAPETRFRRSSPAASPDQSPSPARHDDAGRRRPPPAAQSPRAAPGARRPRWLGLVSEAVRTTHPLGSRRRRGPRSSSTSPPAVVPDLTTVATDMPTTTTAGGPADRSSPRRDQGLRAGPPGRRSAAPTGQSPAPGRRPGGPR